MSEKPKKSFFGNLFGANNESKEESQAKEVIEKETVIADSEVASEETLLSAESEASSEVVAAEKEELEVTDGTVTPEDYSRELGRYLNHQKEYQQEKARYDKVLEEYQTDNDEYNASTAPFSTLSQTIQDAKGMYIIEYENYEQHRAAFEEARANFESAKTKYSELSQTFLQLRNELGLKEAALTDVEQATKESAQSYETQLKYFAGSQQTVEQLTEQFNNYQKELQEISADFTESEEKYNAEKPDYDRAKDRYDFATEVKNDYTRLSKQAALMQEQEDAAKANFDEIKEISDKNSDRLDTSYKVDNFTNNPLATVDESFEAEDKKFREIESRYQAIKTRYDEESANFARIEKNYQDLSASENVNRVALHYVTEEYNGAKEALAKVDEEYSPVQREYAKEEAAHKVISKNYNMMKAMMKEAKTNVSESQKIVEETRKTYAKVEEAYNYVFTQNGILKQNLSSKESQFKEIEDDYLSIVARFEEESKIFDPLDANYQALKEQHDELELAVFNSRQEVQGARVVLETSERQLSELTEELAEAKGQLTKHEQDVADAKDALTAIDQQVQETATQIQTNLGTARERYALTTDKYRLMEKRYEDFSNAHDGYSLQYKAVSENYGKVASLWRLADEEYEKIDAAYQSFEAHGTRVSELYATVMESYTTDKEYYDKVFAEYTKLQASRKEAEAAKEAFDFSAQSMKTLLVLNNNLTFPIYEATGQNYIDSYNLPAIGRSANGASVLENKQQLDAWMTTYTTLHETLVETANDFAKALNDYSGAYENYRAAGGERLTALDNNESAYSGINLAHYIQLLDDQVASWQAEYKVREASFTSLILAYNDYLEREKQLVGLVSANTNAQNSVQAVINLINSPSDFVDMYGVGYGDVNLLAEHLGLDASELTKPKSEEVLRQILQTNYYDRSVSLIHSNLSAFVNNLNALKTNYEAALAELHKSLKHFEISTGISTDNIQITGILNENLDLEKYLMTGLDYNFNILTNAVSGVSSIVNVIRKSGSLNKVANRTIDTTVDNTLVFPDKPINMTQELLNTDVTLYDPKSLPIPVEPDKPADMHVSPVKPAELADEPVFIGTVEKPEPVQEIVQ